MQLSEKNITDFQAIYKEQFGKEISRAEALEKGLSLINLLDLIRKMPIPASIIEKQQKDGGRTGSEVVENTDSDPCPQKDCKP